MNVGRRTFMAMGAGALALSSKAAISDATDRTERRKRINVKAFLCGHLHFEWQGLFGGKVPILVAGRNFNGECYDIAFK